MREDRVREHFLFIACVPREEENCCSKALMVPMILVCSAPAAAQKMKERKHAINT